MMRGTDGLEKQILALFKLACRQNRLDVAEHLLRALETLARAPGVQQHAPGRRTLMKAYGDLICRH